MAEPEKKTPKRKPAVKAKVTAPKAQIKVTPFTFPGIEDTHSLLGESQANEIAGLVKKFQNRYGVKLRYAAKFRSFKLFKKVKGVDKHIDWISMNDLMKRYDCRIRPVVMSVNPQRPYERNRAY